MSDSRGVARRGFGAFTAREQARIAALRVPADGDEGAAHEAEPPADPRHHAPDAVALPYRDRADKTTVRPAGAGPLGPREPGS